MSYQIKTDYASTTPVSSADLNLRGDILQAQLPGAFEAMGIGVLRADDLLVGAGAMAPGGAIVRNEAGRPTYVRVPEALPLPARGDGEFLHLVLRVPEYEDTRGTNSARGAPPILRVSEDEEEPDALLLAQWNGTKWVDRRPFSKFALLAQLASDLGYNDQAREKGSANERLDKLEAPLDETGSGVSAGAFTALANRVAQNESDIADLRAQLLALMGGGNRTARAPLDDLVHEHAITRQMAGRDQRFELERSQSGNIIGTDDGVVFGVGGDHPDFLLATNLTLNPDGSFEP